MIAVLEYLYFVSEPIGYMINQEIWLYSAMKIIWLPKLAYLILKCDSISMYLHEKILIAMFLL